MSSPFQARRAEEKLGLILGRIKAIRVRLNSLAWQQATLGAMAWIIAAAALVMTGAYYLSPLLFLGIGGAVALLALAGLLRTLRAAWSRGVDLQTAASIADRRADLRGRLETIVQVGQARSVVRIGQSAGLPLLWSYLVEDTLARQEDFEPSRIERRRVSRSLYPFLGSLALAAIAFFLIQRVHRRPVSVAGDQNEMTLNLDELHLRPADPDSDSGVQVQADPETMRRLEERMAEAGESGQTPGSSKNNLMNHARNFASNLQRKLTGRNAAHPRIKLKLADASDQTNSPRHNSFAPNPQQKPGEKSGQFQHDNDVSKPDQLHLPKPQHGQHSPSQQPQGKGEAQQGNQSESQRADENGKEQNSNHPDSANQDQGGIGGSSHGIGAEPDSLFGSGTEPGLGSQGFEISIDARPVPTGSKSAGHAYLPPKVKAPLNSNQEPDEPVARAVVPEEDRAAVERVFER